MSADRDQIGVSSIGVQTIVPTTRSSRVSKRRPEDDQDTDKQKHASSHPPGTGKFVDKEV
jgi:hypothetical protein